MIEKHLSYPCYTTPIAHLPSIIGHKQLLASLMHDLTSGNLSHAYLVHGPESIGKTTVLRYFGTEILCHDVQEESEKDVIKEACAKLIHPDFHILDTVFQVDSCESIADIAKTTTFSQEHRREKKLKTNTISIDDVRCMLPILHRTPNGQHAICIMSSIERLHSTAANALLKIVEEPPKGVIFLFSAQAIADIPSTLLSRLRVLHTSTPTKNDMESIANPETEDGALLLTLTRSAPGKILFFLRHPDLWIEEKTQFHNASLFFSCNTPLERMRFLLKEKEEEKGVFEKKIHFLGLALERLPDAKKRMLITPHWNQLVSDSIANVNSAVAALHFILALEREQC